MNNSFVPGLLIGRVRPAGVAAVELVAPVVMRTEITLLLVSRTTDNTIVTVYHDVNGSVWDATNEIITDGRTIVRGAEHPLFQSQGPGTGIMMEIGDSLGASLNLAGDAVISAYGVTQQLAERLRGT